MTPKETIVRHAYEQTAVRLARLACFAETGEVGGYSYEVTFRQAQLATDDVLNVAIACRRLIDSLSLRNLSLTRRVSALSPDTLWADEKTKPEDQTLHDTLNKVIHSSFIEIFSFSYQMKDNIDFTSTLEMITNRELYRLKPVLFFKSDRGPMSFCDLRDLCLALDEILDASQEAAAEHKIFLGEF
ncbi:hypothetical protein NIM87_16055 [Devosia sp. XJ19-1]|uniref:Uncharacterized protein n=1 Tax=Devosia ureilytica TaxID=2952754 RepID=A0A9Q4ARF1_9HYPH|nr:hypothetical protein [Devosia ureilytica]MCP8885024.1 hypothetical protein [Devosia ureilytica]MCP8888465.1 hypothetical protein [Devosia ureilytica]